jgi:hypothetical protein
VCLLHVTFELKSLILVSHHLLIGIPASAILPRPTYRAFGCVCSQLDRHTHNTSPAFVFRLRSSFLLYREQQLDCFGSLDHSERSSSCAIRAVHDSSLTDRQPRNPRHAEPPLPPRLQSTLRLRRTYFAVERLRTFEIRYHLWRKVFDKLYPLAISQSRWVSDKLPNLPVHEAQKS